MSRSTKNFILDLASLLNLLGLIVTGLIVKYILPPGTGGLGREFHGGTGRDVNIEELWLMTRHEWGSIHFYLAVTFIVLMIIHIILHWTWIECYFKSVLNRGALSN
jgi:hypothetical protein